MERFVTEIRTIVAAAYQKSIDWYKKKGFKTFILNLERRDTIPMYFKL